MYRETARFSPDASGGGERAATEGIIAFSEMHRSLLNDVGELRKTSQDSITAKATDFTKTMRPVDDRAGIRAGNPDGTRHDKFADETGKVWLAKDYPRERQHRALVDELVAGLSKKLGFKTTMEAKSGQIDGEFKIFVGWAETQGSLWDNVRGANSLEEFVGGLKSEEIKQIAEEQVLDWLVSNHDPHLGHFLKRPNGGFVSIDKAQAFKYLGDKDERLAWDYNPNGVFNGHNNISYMPAYNIVLPEVAKGYAKASLDDIWQAVEEKITAVEKISDAEYRQALLPYANFRFGVIRSAEDTKKDLTSEKFMELALERKRNLRRDFVRLYEQLREFVK